MATKKQTLSREFSWMQFRLKGAKSILQPMRRNRRIPKNLQRDIANYELALLVLNKTLNKPATRRAYYLLNGDINGD